MVVSFDRIADIYDETRCFPVSVMDKIVKTLMDELEGYVSVLDVGAGTARFSKPLQDLGFWVVGIDVSLEMLRKAVRKGMHNLTVSSVCNLPFEDYFFDATISVGLLHLVKQWRVALQEISRVTRKLLISAIRRGRIPAREEYIDLVEKYGCKLPQLGIAERELAAMIKPAKSIHVTTYEANSGKSLAFLDQRAYSYQWYIPEEKHRRVMQQLKTSSFPKAYPVKVEVLIWDIKTICDFVQPHRIRRNCTC